MKTFYENVRVLGNSSVPDHKVHIQKWKREIRIIQRSLLHLLLKGRASVLCLLNGYNSPHFLISNLFFKL